MRQRFPFIEKIFADAGYQGPKMANTVAATGKWQIAIVKRSDTASGFVSSQKMIQVLSDMLDRQGDFYSME